MLYWSPVRAAAVPGKVLDWARSQTAEFGWGELCENLGISRQSAMAYLSRLARCGLIFRVRKGRYRSFENRPSRRTAKVAAVLSAKMPLTSAVIWSTDQLIHYSDHIPKRTHLFVETAPENVPAIVDVLRRSGRRTVGRPTARDLAESLDMGTEVLVLARKEGCGAVPWKGHLMVASLERALLGTYFLVTRKRLPYPKEEIICAIRRAVREKAVDIRTLRRCAARRNLSQELKRILEGRP